MKLTFIVLLVLASVVVLRAEETKQDVEEDHQPSLTDVYDGSLEDEVMGDEEDPAHLKKRQHMMRTMAHMRICGKVFVKCLIKTKARCKLVPVCKVKYFACRCILKGVSKCRRFLGWVKQMAKKHSQKREKEEEKDDESEDARRKKGKWRRVVRKCKRGYRGCARGKKFCGPCLKKFGGCIKKHIIKHICRKHGHSKKGDEPMEEEDEDEETAMANVVEHEDTEEDEKQVEADEDAHGMGDKKPSAALIRCGKRGFKCMLRAKSNCRRFGKCVRRIKRCVRRAKKRGD